MRVVVSDLELRRMKPADLEKVASETRRAPNGEVADLAAQLRRLEKRYGCTSVEMLRRVSVAEHEETWEICQWLMTYRLHLDLERAQAR